MRVAQLTNDDFAKLYQENSPATPHLQCIIARQVMHDSRSLTNVVRNAMFTGKVENAVLHADDWVDDLVRKALNITLWPFFRILTRQPTPRFFLFYWGRSPNSHPVTNGYKRSILFYKGAKVPEDRP